jgi:hypothetical protein
MNHEQAIIERDEESEDVVLARLTELNKQKLLGHATRDGLI